MEERTRLRVLRLLEEANDRATSVTYEDLPKRYARRAETCRNKLVDLFEDIRQDS